MNLFLDETPEFLKEAAFSARVSEQPENWPMELNSELFKQCPFLSDYDLNVNLDRVDPGRGFAFGYADVSNKTERPEVEHTEMGIPHVRIPLIIIERSVKPFSTFLDGEKVMPMTEERIREILFNPATFDLSTALPRDPSLVEPLMPPQRSGIGMGGEYKMASANCLLLAIAPTLREKDVELFTEKLASDPFLVAGFKRSGISPVLVEALEQTKRASAEERLQAVADNIEPTVMTMMKLPGGGFLVKSASNKAFTPDKSAKGQVVSEEEAGQAVGKQNAQKMQPGQTATAVADPVEDVEPMEASKAKPVEEFGQYKVEDVLGNSIMGHVFPQTMPWDGNFVLQPIALFTNGSAYALQDSIAGELVGKGTKLPEDEPRGDGCFHYVDGGEAYATQPVTIGSAVAGPDGQPKFMATDSFGNPLVLTQVEGLKAPMSIDGNELAIPDTWKFMRLNNQTQLAGSVEEQSKVGSAISAETEVELFYNGGFQFKGGCGLDKIASEFRQDLDAFGAEFLLGLLGVDGSLAKTKVAEARKKGQVKLANLKEITLLGEHFQEAEKTASAFLSKLPDLRKDLLKEAAAMDDANTVDKILALNFVNPENLETFIGYLPELEKTAENLAEMLLFSYLGMNELPEAAIDRSMRALEEVITGLKGIAGSEL